MQSKISTAEKLLLAAIDVMSMKGYNGASTKEIAAKAGVNEVTLFRHYGNKAKLLEAALDRFHYADVMIDLFHNLLTGELESDLLLIARTYQSTMFRNKKLFSIVHKEGNSLPIDKNASSRHPEKLRELLTEYFTGLKERGEIETDNPALLAESYQCTNFGYFNSRLNSDQIEPDSDTEQYIQHMVQIFVKALKAK